MKYSDATSESSNSTKKSNLQSDDNLIKNHVSQENVKRVFFKRRKTCPLSMKDSPVIDYKDPDTLSKFVSEGGRILPSRITNVCAKKQRKLKNAIRKARILALLPFVSDCVR